MARTRGGHSSENTERQRPTASVRRLRGQSNNVGQNVGEDEDIHDVGVGVHEVVGDAFPGGPVDTILLRSYTDHVARHLWDGEVSLFGSLTMYIFVRKMFMMLLFFV